MDRRQVRILAAEFAKVAGLEALQFDLERFGRRALFREFGLKSRQVLAELGGLGGSYRQHS
jgi:hypothetical protein